MAFNVEMGELPGRSSGYTSREKHMLESFVRALPDDAWLAEILDRDFVRDDGLGQFRIREVGSLAFRRFRSETVGESSVPDPDRPTKGYYIARALGSAMVGEETYEDLPTVVGVLEVNYQLAEPFPLPSGGVMPAGERYSLRVVEAPYFKVTGDGPDDWKVAGRRAVFVDAPFPPAAIEREYYTRLEGGDWPPFPTEDILRHPPDLTGRAWQAQALVARFGNSV